MTDGLRCFSPDCGNSAAAAVCEVLDAIGAGSPGWNRCGASKTRRRFVSAAKPVWSARRRQREAGSALDTFRGSLRAKAKCLAEHAKTSGHRLCGDDFYAALEEHDVLLAKETYKAVGVLAKTFDVKDCLPLLRVPEGESVE